MRRRAAERRELLPDPIYHSTLVTRFINMVMQRGKKSLAERIVYGAFDRLRTQTKSEEVLPAFQKAVENARPFMEVKSRRVGGRPIKSRWRSMGPAAPRWRCGGSVILLG